MTGCTENSPPWPSFWPLCTTVRRAIGRSTSITAMPIWGGCSIRLSSSGAWGTNIPTNCTACARHGASQGCMWEDRAVLVHGDVTPSNFLIGRGHDVMAIDLERMQWADRVFDLGRLCGELKHFFFQAKGDPHAAEPFIGHFLWEYCCHFPDRMSAFRAITRRTPFYMGITLLRIARNSWIDQDYRWRLVQEAKQILRGLP